MVIETPQSAVGDARIGEAIGHHIVRRKLVEGDMGSVHVAEHPEAPVEIRLTLPATCRRPAKSPLEQRGESR